MLYDQVLLNTGESCSTASADPIAMMEFYMKKAAQEERRRQPRQSKYEMPPPPSLQGPAKKGHHMGDFIPPEELERFLASCNDAFAQRLLERLLKGLGFWLIMLAISFCQKWGGKVRILEAPEVVLLIQSWLVK
ncbi:SURP and G-patch domain-containing protein 1-like protein [Eucalyptus grandis]|uniref:SURP and G-patch domain-containing protein 1-like protein n=1 Tax=Eucalyptus grandis TaxID=71139 RepID=UPI00192EED68|nr:SURP and G-patch domain-containing protein 1-like protein [Eucalyptus grandis]